MTDAQFRKHVAQTAAQIGKLRAELKECKDRCELQLRHCENIIYGLQAERDTYKAAAEGRASAARTHYGRTAKTRARARHAP